MINTGDGLRVRICSPSTYYYHWMSFACYVALKRNLPDATVELVIQGKPTAYFDWARTLRLRVIHRDMVPVPLVEAQPGLVALSPECVSVRPWTDERLLSGSWASPDGAVCVRRDGDCVPCDFLCGHAKDDPCTPFVSAARGAGSFVPEKWLHRSRCFLSLATEFKAVCDTPAELAVINEWQRATLLATGLGLNQS